MLLEFVLDVEVWKAEVAKFWRGFLSCARRDVHTTTPSSLMQFYPVEVTSKITMTAKATYFFLRSSIRIDNKRT